MDNNDNNQYNAERRREEFFKSLKRFGVLLGAVLIFVGAGWALLRLTGMGNGAVSTSLGPAIPTSLAQSGAAAARPEDSYWNFVGPQQQEPGEMTLTAPDYRMVALPANGRVDIKYFESVTFVGDSITQGFDAYPSVRIPGASYCSYKNIGPKQVFDGSVQKRYDGHEEVPMDALVASKPKNVYILLGTNALVGLSPDSIVEYYAEMLRQMRERLPAGTNYYIQSVTPVRPEVTRLSMDNIHQLNHGLAKLAWESGAYFIDLNEVLAGDDAFLREEYAGGDGIHLKPGAYQAWTEYLITHTAYSPDNPYLEGSNEPVPPA